MINFYTQTLHSYITLHLEIETFGFKNLLSKLIKQKSLIFIFKQK